MSDSKSITASLQKDLKKNPLVAGLVLVGSWARKDVYTANRYSDMEMYILVKDGKVQAFEKQLPGIVNNLGKIIFSYKNRIAGFSAVFEDFFRLELPVVKESDISSVFSRPTAQTVKILIDKTNGALKEVLKNRSQTMNYEKFFQEKVIDFWYMVILTVQYYKKGEIWNCRSAFQMLQSTLIKMFELLENQKVLLLESNKRIEQFLSTEQIKLLKSVSPAYNKDEIQRSLELILDIFSGVVKQIACKYHYKYNQEIENYVKPRLKALLKQEDDKI